MTIDQAGPYKGTFLPDPVEDIVSPCIYFFGRVVDCGDLVNIFKQSVCM